MKISIFIGVVALSISGCIDEQDSYEGREEVDENTEQEEYTAEAISPSIRVGIYVWGFTDCVTKSEAELMISLFGTMALGGFAGTSKLGQPWSKLAGTVVVEGYWGWLALEFAKANNATGSKGVCTDWYWVPIVKDIYPWY